MASKMKFGLNLFSLRKQIGTKEALIATLARLKDLGYDYVQYSGGPWEPAWVKEASEQTGMPVVLTHVKLAAMLEAPAKLVAEHKLFGCENVGLGMFEFRGVDEATRLEGIAKIGEAAEKITAAGGKFFYHNHNFEFQKLSSGKTVFDTLFEAHPDVNFILDTFWLQAGGVAILEYIEKLKGRIGCVHLKDFLPTFVKNEETGKYESKPKFAPVGDGNINWHAVIPAFVAAGATYFLVEQDDATDYEDPFEQVGRSIKYLKENF
ncbi:MAG: sugar phosphate isomerase/epimerase [Clostridia bacterium]|nr:sugar phosphate isomerase/epimerase [Clostridia bacterium]